MGDMDNFTPDIPKRCPRCGKEIMTTTDKKCWCLGCGELYYDEHLGVWRIKYYNEK